MKTKFTLQSTFFILLIFFSTYAFTQSQTFYVNLHEIDPNYATTEDSIPISFNPSNSNDKLFLFLGGTGSNSATSYLGLNWHSANQGFKVINLAYPNSVPAVLLANSSNNLAFDQYREEICFGNPVSNVVQVDSLNAIVTRTLKILEYLVETDPDNGWENFLTSSNNIDWSKIIVGGHSQGAGHAAYLGQRFSMDRVLMFSGPNDYSDFFSAPANWLKQDGITLSNRHFAYLHLNDEVVDFSKQFANLSELGLLEVTDSTFTDILETPFNNANLLYTTETIGAIISQHSVPIINTLQNRNVWTYMLTRDIMTNIEVPVKEMEIQIFPNPVNSILNLKINRNLKGKSILIQNIFGQIVFKDQLTESNYQTVFLGNLESGIYFLSIENMVLKILKE